MKHVQLPEANMTFIRILSSAILIRAPITDETRAILILPTINTAQ
jgi:hypothetical protein